MKRRLLYLINPISGVKNKPLLRTAIKKRMAEAQLDYEIEDTRADGNYKALAARIQPEGITDIIICGGDGSVGTVASFLLRENVNVGIVPMGSGNGLALAAGIPYATKRALDIIVDGSARWVDGFYLNNSFSCMMCGVGNDAQVAHDFAGQRTRGLVTYLRLSAINYFRSKHYPFSIRVGEELFDTDAYFIVIANGNQFGNYVTIAPRASLSDGLLDIVVVRKMSKLVLPFALLSQISGNNPLVEKNVRSATGNILYFKTPEITITNHGKAPVHIDGEPCAGERTLSFRIHPNAFRLLQPG